MSIVSEIVSFFSAAMQSIPFMALAVLGYLSMRNGGIKPVAIAWLFCLIVMFILVDVGCLVLGSIDIKALGIRGVPAGQSLALLPNARSNFAVGLTGISIALLVGALGFVPAIRRLIARFSPLDPASFVHTLALVAVITITILCFVPLVAVHEPPLLKLIDQLGTDQQDSLGMSGGAITRAELYTLIWQVPCAILAVGLGIKRNFRESISRVGLVRPTIRYIAIGIGTAALLVVVVTFMSRGITALWQQLGWPTTDESQVNKLMAFALNPFSALTIALVAGLGEELTVRGVLQPRLGIVLPNIFFASLHALQYNLDGVLVVFVVGLALALLRAGTNTTTSAIAHGSYDFILLMLAAFQLPTAR